MKLERREKEALENKKERFGRFAVRRNLGR